MILKYVKKCNCYSKLFLSSILFYLLVQILQVHQQKSNVIDEKEDFVVKSEDSSKWPIVLKPSYGSYLENIDLSQLSKEEKTFVKKYMPIMLNRIKRVSEFCSTHRDPMFRGVGFSKHLIWIQRRMNPNIVWCCCFKAGSGTWTVNFLREAHFNENNPEILSLPPSLQDIERFKESNGATYSTLKEMFPLPQSPEKTVEIFRNSIRFLNVRHPFSRLLSAYRNIIEAVSEVEEEPIFRELRKEIIQRHRSSSSTNKSEFPTFSEYVDYFINTSKDLKTYHQWRNITRNAIGDYWEPFWTNCNICAFDPQIIVKLETHKKDELFLTILADLKQIKRRKQPEWRHKINEKSSQDLAKDYYKNLTLNQIWSLYEAYKTDFEIFDYNIDTFME